MYIPKQFEIKDNQEIFNFIKQNAFGQLISQHQGLPVSTHLPFLVLEEESKLVCHLAKVNPQYKDIVGQTVLITFLGPHGYISPSWHDQPGVATWNYQAVHVYGKCKVIEDPIRLKEIVETLTAKYEGLTQSNWEIDYQDILLNAIMGIEIDIKEIQCKYKLSQNRSKLSQKQIIKNLEMRGNQLLASAMKQHLGE
jgi:transcriptional regulator